MQNLNLPQPKEDHESKVPPLFIVGAPRSGTTLFQLLVSSHSNFYSLPETHFFTHVWPNLPSTKRDSDWWRLFFELLEEKPKIRFGDLEKENIRSRSNRHSPRALLEALILEYKNKKQLKGCRWVEKTPRHVNHLEKILALWPSAKILNVFRDPRDAISSFHHKAVFSWAYQNYFDIFHRIKKYRHCHADRVRCASINILDMKYEDLVQDPEGQLKRIMNFLGEEFEPTQMQVFSSFFESATTPDEKHKELCKAGKIVDRREVWRQRLDADEVFWIEKQCAPILNALGYVSSRPAISLVQKAKWHAFWILYQLRCFLWWAPRQWVSEWIPRRWKRKLKTIQNEF